MKNYLDFEKEIKALEQEVDNLKSPFGSEGISEVDTQKIKNMYAVSDTGELMGKKAVMGALTLYLDFINLFIMLLRLFGQRR